MITRTITLPHQSAGLYLTDGGLETTLVFLEGFDLPCFAAFDLLKDAKGYAALQDYYRRYLSIAKEFGASFILESPTWRANPDWIEKTGYPRSAITSINEKAVQLLSDLKTEFSEDIDVILVSGCVGPRGDGYKAEHRMNAEEARQYHAAQVEVFRHAAVDLVSAITMNYVEEAIGIARAAGDAGLPVVISFTVETDGKLPTGMRLKDAIRQVDESVPTPPVYYMINCAHPTHFGPELLAGQHEDWTKRIRGLRANASCKSHAELDEATTLDRGDPVELGKAHKGLNEAFPQLNVLGGCCGTDEAHLLEIVRQLATTKGGKRTEPAL